MRSLLNQVMLLHTQSDIRKWLSRALRLHHAHSPTSDSAQCVWEQRQGWPDLHLATKGQQMWARRWSDRLTCTAAQVRHEGVATAAATLVTALRVGAKRFTAAILDGAFVNVCKSKTWMGMTMKLLPLTYCILHVKSLANVTRNKGVTQRKQCISHLYRKVCPPWTCIPCHRRTGSVQSC